MDVRTCKQCKSLYNHITGPNLCPACKEALEKKFQEVKKYLFDHKGASVMQVSEECEVEESQIRQWIREERLEFSSGLSGVLCESCGTPISTGKYCDRCKASMLNDLKSVGRISETPVIKPKQEDRGNRMRFLNQ